jgi:hypothetical protein
VPLIDPFMLPQTAGDGDPHRDVISFRVYDGERLHVIGEVAGEKPRDIVSTSESGKFAILPLPDDLEAKIVDPSDIKNDIDISEMRMVGDAIGIEERGQATAELRVDGEVISDCGARGVYGLLWLPIMPDN